MSYMTPMTPPAGGMTITAAPVRVCYTLLYYLHIYTLYIGSVCLNMSVCLSVYSSVSNPKQTHTHLHTHAVSQENMNDLGDRVRDEPLVGGGGTDSEGYVYVCVYMSVYVYVCVC